MPGPLDHNISVRWYPWNLLIGGFITPASLPWVIRLLPFRAPRRCRPLRRRPMPSSAAPVLYIPPFLKRGEYTTSRARRPGCMCALGVEIFDDAISKPWYPFTSFEAD